jgi:hypothetical protein
MARRSLAAGTLWHAVRNVLLDPKEPDLITGEPAIPTVPCLLARMAAIVDREAFTAQFLEKVATSSPAAAAALAVERARRPHPLAICHHCRHCIHSATTATTASTHTLPPLLSAQGRFSKQHFTEDLEIYEALEQTGEIDILKPKRNGSLKAAIACDDEGFLDFLQSILKVSQRSTRCPPAPPPHTALGGLRRASCLVPRAPP